MDVRLGSKDSLAIILMEETEANGRLQSTYNP